MWGNLSNIQQSQAITAANPQQSPTNLSSQIWGRQNSGKPTPSTIQPQTAPIQQGKGRGIPQGAQPMTPRPISQISQTAAPVQQGKGGGVAPVQQGKKGGGSAPVQQGKGGRI